MKKYIKILLGIVIFLGFNSVVYASNQCFYMPGKNNKFIVPKGYSARCYYELSSTKSNNGGQNKSYEQIFFEYKRFLDSNGKYVDSSSISGTSGFGDSQMTIFTFDEAFQPVLSSDVKTAIEHAEDNYINFDGLKIYNSKFESYVDPDINGCPESIYLISNNVSPPEYKVGFSSTDNPSLSFPTGSKYLVYNYVNSIMDDGDEVPVYDDVMLISDANSNNTISFPANFEKEKYDKLVKQCDPDTTTGNQSGGYGDQNELITNDKVETLASCSYYFELKNHYADANNTCYAQKVTFTFQKKTTSGKSSLSVTSDLNGLNLSNIENQINLVKLNDTSTYSKLNDYLVYRNGKWMCPEKVYIWDNNINALTVFGQSRYSTYEAAYGVNEIAVSKESNADLCVPNGDKNDGSGNIDWGDKVEVNCDGIIGKELLDFINKIFRWIQIIAPIIVIVLGFVEFGGAVLQDDKDALKKASSKLIKRLIIAVVLFFIPLILGWLLTIFNNITGAASSTCGIGG